MGLGGKWVILKLEAPRVAAPPRSLIRLAHIATMTQPPPHPAMTKADLDRFLADGFGVKANPFTVTSDRYNPGSLQLLHVYVGYSAVVGVNG